ncbi:MAG: GNAT family N-acetyltransferase [Gammaproteobacteria bacterium]
MINIVQADFSNKNHSDDYVRVLSEYALDVMGGGTALNSRVQNNLASEIAKREFITVFMAYEKEHAIALITCIEGFSTFQCRPLINIHDVYVAKDYRGLGVSTKLLLAAEKLAITNSCCKLTLEVLQGNTIAKKAYQKLGFKSYELNPDIGGALFWEKILD